MELLLVDAGYTLAEIRGSTEVHTHEEPPSGAAAILGHVQPRVASLAAVGALALGALAALETGLTSLLVAAVGASVLLYLAGQYHPEAQEVRTEVQRPGMSHQEVLDRGVQYQEFKTAQKEHAEAEAEQQMAGVR